MKFAKLTAPNGSPIYLYVSDTISVGRDVAGGLPSAKTRVDPLRIYVRETPEDVVQKVEASLSGGEVQPAILETARSTRSSKPSAHAFSGDAARSSSLRSGKARLKEPKSGKKRSSSRSSK